MPSWLAGDVAADLGDPRGTRVFRVGGDWLMVHQHVSFPHDPETGRAATDLVP